MADERQIRDFIDSLTPENRAIFLRLPVSDQHKIVESASDKVESAANDKLKAKATNLAVDQAVKYGTSYLTEAGTAGVETASKASGLANTGQTGTPMFDVGAPSYAGYLGAARDAYNLYGDLKGDKLRDEEKATRAQQQIALAVADVYTGGLAGMAEGYLRKNPKTRKYLEKLDKLDRKTNPLTIAINKWGTSDKWKTEGDRLEELKKRGVTIAESDAPPLTRGRTKEQLIAEEKAKIAAGKHGNVEFAETRDVKSLKGKDIWGYSAFYDKFGSKWLQMSEPEREAIAEAALKADAVKEHHGTIDVDWGKLGGSVKVGKNIIDIPKDFVMDKEPEKVSKEGDPVKSPYGGEIISGQPTDPNFQPSGDVSTTIPGYATPAERRAKMMASIDPSASSAQLNKDWGQWSGMSPKEAKGIVAPLASIMTGNNSKIKTDFASRLSEKVTSSGAPKETLMGMYDQAGLDANKALQSITAMQENGSLSSEEAEAYKQSVSQLLKSEVKKPGPRREDGDRAAKAYAKIYMGANI